MADPGRDLLTICVSSSHFQKCSLLALEYLE